MIFSRSPPASSKASLKRELLIVLLCVGIALPLLLLAASLLGQADANFGALLEDLSQWQLSDEALSQLMRLLLGLPVGAYLYGLLAGAAFCHNFGLASSGNGPTDNGKIAVVVGIAAVAVIACVNTFRKESK